MIVIFAICFMAFRSYRPFLSFESLRLQLLHVLTSLLRGMVRMVIFQFSPIFYVLVHGFHTCPFTPDFPFFRSPESLVVIKSKQSKQSKQSKLATRMQLRPAPCKTRHIWTALKHRRSSFRISHRNFVGAVATQQSFKHICHMSYVMWYVVCRLRILRTST